MSSLLDNRNDLAFAVCGKPKDISFDKCHASGKQNPLCTNSDKCRIAEKTEEQLGYIFTSNSENTFLTACPGSGKTESVGLKAAYEIKQWNRKPGGIAVLTFTNSATDVIADRVTQFAGIEKLHYPHYIGTIDSWLHGYMAHPFGHVITSYKGKEDDHSLRLVNENCDDNGLNQFKLKTSYCYYRKGGNTLLSMPLYASNLLYDHECSMWEIKIPGSSEYKRDEEYFNSKAFTEFRDNKQWLTLEYLRNKFENNKNDFYRAGFATYRDIENICYRLLKDKSRLAKLLASRFPFIIVAECQDLSWVQLQIFKMLSDAGACVHFVGDLNQGIYAFKKVYPKKVEEFISQNSFKELKLSHNFRSIQPIVDVCGKLVKQGEITGESSEENHEPSCVYFTYNKDQIQKVVEHFILHIKERDIKPQKCAIVARGRAVINKLRPSSMKMPEKKALWLPTAIHLWKNQNQRSELMKEALNCIGRLVTDLYYKEESANINAYYCPERVPSRLQWRLFLNQLRQSLPETTLSLVRPLSEPFVQA